VRRAAARLERFESASLVHVESGRRTPVDLAGAEWVAPVGFSDDGSYLAFLAARDQALYVAWTRCADGLTTVLDGHAVNATFAEPVSWRGSRLFSRFVPSHDGASRTSFEPFVFDSPETTITGWNRRGDATESGADAIERYFRSQIASVDVGVSRATPHGEPGVFTRTSASPDGRLLLVARLAVPFEGLHALSSARTVEEIHDCTRDGASVHTLAAPPFAPSRDSAAGWRWHPFKPATLVTVARADSGDILIEAEEPFDVITVQPLTLETECVRHAWTTEGELLTWEQDRQRQTLALRVTSDGAISTAPVWEGHMASGDVPVPSWRFEGLAARDELIPVWSTGRADGLAVQRGTTLFVTGARVCDGRRLPFLDRIDLQTSQRSSVVVSRPDLHEHVVAVLNDDASLLLTVAESPEEPPEFRISHQQHKRRDRVAAPHSVDRAPALHRERVRYEGYDRSELTCSFYYDRDRVDGTALSTLIWIYPELAGFLPVRDRLYDNQWVGADGISPLALLDHGYAIAHFPQLPLRPSAENPAGMTGQLVDTISSLVEALVAAGAARDRIAIGGHCLGAYASTQLLASSRLFCAGIACGGFYNLTNRPKGWLLTGRRSMEDCPDAYLEGSPLLHPERIVAPLLLMHGEHDEFLWLDPAFETRQMYLAMASTGGTARYVCLLREGHRYQARESLDIFNAELLRWCDAHVKRVIIPPAR